MNIQAEKLELVRLIVETDNPSILASIKKLFLKEGQEDFWNKLHSDQKTEILEGLKEVDAGEIVDYEDFINKHK